MFTIEVKKRGKDEEFSFRDLEMSHQECIGGRIGKDNRTLHHEPPEWALTCYRCRARRVVHEEVLTAIIATAVDGQERESQEKDEKIRVIQKT